jgi:hypothetical protein
MNKLLILIVAVLLLVKCEAVELTEDFDVALNSNYWTEFQIGSYGYISVECPDELDRLRISKDSHEYDGKSKKGGIISRFFVDGDLSFFVDFDIISMPFTGSESSFNEVCIALVSVETGGVIYWVRATNDVQNTLLGYSSDLGIGFGAMEDDTISGRAGISRTGNVVALHIDRGEGNVIFTSLENPIFAGPMYVQMHIKQAGSPVPTTELDMRYDKFVAEADIIKCPPRITMPKGGDNIVADKDYLIVWENPAFVTQGDYSLEYTTDGGSTYNLIEIVDVLEGQYLWHTPSLSRNHCMLRLVLVDDENVNTKTGEFIIFICSQEIPGDINGDCYVNLIDLAILASNWMACGNRFFEECQY